jgi:RND family efflux transporter MFP subunit
LQNEEGFPHKGNVDYASPTVSPTTGTLAARAIFANPDRTLLPGFFVRVRIPEEQLNALLVPDAALGSDQGGRYLLVVGNDNVVQQRNVTLGIRVGNLRVIESGLDHSDKVVIGGIVRALPGQKVDPQLQTITAAK